MNSMNIMQINLNHCRAAQDLMFATAAELAVDLILVSDFWSSRPGWHVDSTGLAAVIVLNRNIRISRTFATDGLVAVWTGGLVICSVYLSPNRPLEEFTAMADELSQLRAHRCLIGGDFNAHSPAWGSSREDARGEIVLETIAQCDWELINRGNSPTFIRGPQRSWLDLSICSGSLLQRIRDWTVLQRESLSDHLYITYTLIDHPVIPALMQHGKLNMKRLSDALDAGLHGVSTLSPASLDSILSEACARARLTTRPSRARVYWWSEEVASKHRICASARRALARARRADGEDAPHAAVYREARRELRAAIADSKGRSWRSLIDDLEADIWGKAYQIISQRTGRRRRPELLPPEMINEIVHKLFPDHPPFTRVAVQSGVDVPPVTDEELDAVVARLRPRAAPGPDGVPSGALRMLVAKAGPLMKELFTSCLRSMSFPANWKIARLLLLPKGKGEGASAFRPLCLLNETAKMFERIIVNRLNDHLQDYLSPQQYGFRKGRGTIDALRSIDGTLASGITGMVLLDVRNAFNSCSWKRILIAARKASVPPYLLGTIDEYLQDRYLLDDAGGTYSVSSGVPQGSAIGPTLWNLLYNPIFSLPLPAEARVVGFADDITVLVRADDERRMKEVVDASTRIIAAWMAAEGLSVAPEKTEFVLVVGRRWKKPYSVCVCDTTIPSSPSAKCLGLIFDRRRNFSAHITSVTVRARSFASSLCWLLPNVGGPSCLRRHTMAAAFNSVLLYGAEIWGGNLLARDRAKLISAQRVILLRCAAAYRTVSSDAVAVVAGLVPIDILAEERFSLSGSRRDSDVRAAARGASVVRWQRRWSSSSRGRFTFRLIPDIDRWLGRSHGVVDHYVTQLLTGHGDFGTYLHRFGKRDSPLCPSCGVLDDPEHTFLACPLWPNFANDPDIVTLEDVVARMLSSQVGWNTSAVTIRATLRSKFSRV